MAVSARYSARVKSHNQAQIVTLNARPKCGKLTHLTEAHALDQLRIQKDRDNKKRANRLQAYWCPQCGGWHVGHDRFSGKALKYYKQRQRNASRAT